MGRGDGGLATEYFINPNWRSSHAGQLVSSLTASITASLFPIMAVHSVPFGHVRLPGFHNSSFALSNKIRLVPLWTLI